MIGLNLLPDIKKEFIKAQRTRNTVISLSILTMVIVVGLTVFMAMFVYGMQALMIKGTKDDIAENHAIFNEKPEVGKYLTIQNQLNGLSLLHSNDSKSIYSRTLDYLTKLNPADPNKVQLSSVEIVKETKAMVLRGSAADFHAVNVFKTTLEKGKLSYKLDEENEEPTETNLFVSVVIKSANLSSSSSGDSGVNFEMEAVYSPEIFWPFLKEINLIVPRDTISDSKDNAPSDLFEPEKETEEE